VMTALGAAMMPSVPAYAADQMYEDFFGESGMQYLQGATWYTQTFTAEQNHQVTSVKLYLCKYGYPGTVTVSIRATDSSGKPTGSDLASGTTNGNTLPQYGTGDEWRQVALSPTLSLTQNTKYAIVVRAPTGDASNEVCWNASYFGDGDLYTGGAMYESTNSGANWNEEWWWDGSFQIWGPYSPPPNQSPVLSNGYVTPTSGDNATDFYYYVHYYDADGDSPGIKNVYIDNVAHAMTLYSGSPSNGYYRLGPVNLDCNTYYFTHRYSFSFSDGQGHTTCLPVSCSGFFPGPDIALGEAVDNTLLSWSTGGDAQWFGQCSYYYWDHDAAQSGWIDHSRSTWIETTVNGPGTLRFHWKVSSEPNWDWLEFYLDSVIQDRISGETDWQFQSYSLSSGAHILRWRYVKDGSVTSGSNCGWLDKVEFIPPLYVSASGCGGLTPCYSTIQAALNVAADGSVIKVAQGTYNEAPTKSTTGTVTISGGWDSTFTSRTGISSMYAPSATGGAVLKVQPNIKLIAPQ